MSGQGRTGPLAGGGLLQLVSLGGAGGLEIIVEALICASAFYIFIVHTFTAKGTFVNPRLFLDRNFAVGMVFIFIKPHKSNHIVADDDS